jgi:hypothetical protein
MAPESPRRKEAMMLLSFLVLAALLLMLGARIAASPPFALLSLFFANWAERCHSSAEQPRR